MVTDESQEPEDLADPQAGTSPWLFLVPSDPPHGAWDVAHVAASLTAVQSEALAAPREVGLNLDASEFCRAPRGVQPHVTVVGCKHHLQRRANRHQ